MNNSSGYQSDGSIIDLHGRRISSTDVAKVIETVNGLPATQQKGEFLLALKENPIIIVQGETGSGKTTQFPKLAHFEYPQKNIVVTQPRRFAATSNAQRVADEALFQTKNVEYTLGHKIGYRTSPDKKAGHETRLAFHTDGLELMRQGISGLIPDILFLDEVHNFAIPTEIVAMLARTNQKAMKIVIMSATLDPEIFRSYYRDISKDIPLIQVPGRTHGIDTDFDAEGPMMNDIKEMIRAKKNILFFTSGKKEIQGFIELFKHEFGKEVDIFPLHSELPHAEQNMLLEKRGIKPYIIVATNVAEESVTIPYIDFVVDLATHKVSRYTYQGIPMLIEEPISQANAKQRSGRAGRVKPGISKRYNPVPFSELREYPEAPIEREMIDRYILILLSQGVDIIRMIYEGATMDDSPFFHHLEKGLFDLSLKKLRSIGALTNRNELTVLGHELLKFPIEIYHARMLYESIDRGCSKDITTYVAILEKKGFLSKEDKWKELLTKAEYASDLEGYSELLDIVTATELSKENIQKLLEMGVKSDDLADFMDRKGGVKLYEVVDLSMIGIKNKKVKEIDDCRVDLEEKLVGMGIELTKSTDPRATKIALASGYSNLHFIYNEKEKKFSDPLEGRVTGFFRQGDVSLLEVRAGQLYLGSPFIIGSIDDRPDLALLTHIIPVNHSILADAGKSNKKYSHEVFIPPKNIKQTNVNSSSQSVTQGVSTNIDEVLNGGSVSPASTSPVATRVFNSADITLLYQDAVEDFNTARHATQEDAQLFYLNYCLMPFLMAHNKHIKNYISGKDDDWVNTFEEILKEFLLKNDLYRINPDNRIKTESSFRHDADILRRFQESQDSYIKNFRLHGIHSLKTKVLTESSVEERKEDQKLNLDRADQRIAFATLVGKTNSSNRQVSLSEIENYELHIILANLVYCEGSEKAIKAYEDIVAVMDSLTKMSVSEVQGISQTLKGIGNRQKEYQKKLLIEEKLVSFQRLLKKDDLQGIDKKELLKAVKGDYFGSMDTKEIEGYHTFVERITSEDSRKKKRANVSKKKYQDLVTSNIRKLHTELSHLKKQLPYEHIKEAGIILTSIETIACSIFQDEYVKLNISSRFYDMMRAIVRDSITEKKGLQNILKEGFAREGMGQHMRGMKSSHGVLEEYAKYKYQLEPYMRNGPIWRAVLESQDLDELTQYVKNLGDLLKKLDESAKKVDANKIWIRFNERKYN
ncbi:ATP-dependent RNA helicase [Candidatus Gracilibacteria bacterium]|nr:ATP-dependent RNA helicase [Candidatus Gracilibacteria bacterium]